jgi:transposase
VALFARRLPALEHGDGYFAKWRDDGTWERVNDALRRRARAQRDREPEPSAAIVDSQSANTTEKGASAASTARS